MTSKNVCKHSECSLGGKIVPSRAICKEGTESSVGTRAQPGWFSLALVEVLDPGTWAGLGRREAREAEKKTTCPGEVEEGV